jgi:hypothetical protein
MTSYFIEETWLIWECTCPVCGETIRIDHNEFAMSNGVVKTSCDRCHTEVEVARQWID